MATIDVEECLRRIGRLPHADVIDPEAALRWVRLTMGIDPGRIGWHIARAGGVGGSEAGALVSWAYGGFRSRGSAERLAKGKLLILPPDRANDDMARGSFLEDHIRGVFEARLDREGREWRRRDDVQALVEAGPHPDHPWLRASLDGVYEIDGALVIVDFKAPSEDSLDGYSRHRDFHDYRAQLNHYALVAEGRGVEVDALMLAMYDYRRAASVGVRIFDIERDPVLQQRIVNASAAFWNDHVARGIVPEGPRERVLGADGGIPEEVERAARRAVISKIIADKASRAYEADQEIVARWIASTGRVGDGVLPLGSLAEGAEGFLQVRAKAVLDKERAVRRLRDLGVAEDEIEAMRGPDRYDTRKIAGAYDDMVRLMIRLAGAARAGRDVSGLLLTVDKLLSEAPVKEKGDYDEEKLLAALDSLHETPYPFLIEKISSGLPRGRRQDLEERRAMVAAELDEVLEILAARERAPEEELPEGPAFAR